VLASPKPDVLRSAIASSIAEHRKAYDVAAFCELLGLAPASENEDPHTSKFGYVNRRLQPLSMSSLVDLARRLLAEWDDDSLQALVDAVPSGGVDGDGPKPQIVLRDAINNDLQIVRHGERCLVYDRPLTEAGLSWADLVEWWADTLRTADLDLAARHLWKRLARSLASDAERTLFNCYTARYGRAGFSIPALVPQVYLHYDPYARSSPHAAPAGAVVRQRMDFLLLLPRRARVVLEVDGRHHYADDSGAADPARYASMVAEDRRLRLSGYEIYRFGGQELVAPNATSTLDSFFDALLARHQAST
jgi:hypothetical protein